MADVQSSRHHADSSGIFANEQGTDEQRAARLRQIQTEALGTVRRDKISTDDFNDRTRVHLSLRDMECRRRVNQQGTHESAVNDDAKDKVKSWNTAWNHMKDDGILEEGLQDLNAGQSHRARLISQALPAYLPQSPALPLPRSALEEAQQFFLQVKGRNPSRGGGRGGRGGGIAGSQPDRHAQRRVPTATGAPSLLQNPKVKPRVVLPSITGRSPAPEPPKEYISSAVEQSRTLQKKAENFRLVQPNQFMAHVNDGKKFTTTTSQGKAGIASNASPAVRFAPVARGSQAPITGDVPKFNLPSLTKAVTGALLDADMQVPDERTSSSPHKSYAEDLLDIAIDAPNELIPPMELSPKVADPNQPIADQHELRQMEAQLASFLPYLILTLPPEAIEKLTSVRSALQQQISTLDIQAGPSAHLAGIPLLKTTQVKQIEAQSPAVQNQSHPTQPQDKGHTVGTGSLATTVKQRTREWSQQVIASTVSTKGSIFGEHLVRSRWTGRHNSTASVASSTGLVEGIKKLRLDETQLPSESQSIGSAEIQSQSTTQYATTNPFGQTPTTGGQTLPSHTQIRQNDNAELAAPVAKPRVPDYVRTGYHPEDHGAAVRAQYLRQTPAPTEESHEEVLPNAASTNSATSPQATFGAHEYVVASSQGPLVWRNHATATTMPDPPRANDHRPLRRESVSSAGASTISPGLGEDMNRPRHSGGIRLFTPLTPSAPKSASFAPEPGSLLPPRRPSGPRPPPFLRDAQPASDHGAAARAQYGQGGVATRQSFTQPVLRDPNLAQVAATRDASRASARPRPVGFPAEAEAAIDLEAVARKQYNHTELTALREQATPDTQFSSISQVPKRSTAQEKRKGKITDYFGSSSAPLSSNEETQPMPRYKSGSEPQFTKINNAEPPKPSSWLSESVKDTDPGAAARKQYGMTENQKQ